MFTNFKAFVQETGGYPSRSSDNVSERTLAEWLQRRRREAAVGTLAPAYRQALAVLPGWRGTPRAAAARFRQRRGELASAKVEALDAAVPGWRTGRTRGRKPKH